MPKGETKFRLLIRGKSLYVSLSHELNVDLRFGDVPTFGRGTIRCFTDNVSDMKKLAGHNFEDILQVRSTLSIFIG